MITENNFEEVLNKLGFCANGGVYEKNFSGGVMKADIKNRRLIYPAQIGTVTYDESRRENLVVFECVNRLLEKGYNAADIELEKTWALGHEQKSGRADIVVSQNGRALFIIECKTAGGEFSKELRNMKIDGGQLFSYWQQENSCKWLILYAADFDGKNFAHQIKTVNCSDYQNLLDLEDKQPDTKLFKNAHTVEDKFAVWDETYEKNFEGDLIFSEESSAYDIGVKPKRKCHLEDFSKMSGVINEFEEILRHNNVSDKENAFNRLIALFICKLMDEAGKGDNDVVEFFYNAASDTYEALQDRLQRLHRDGMQKFMNETIFYLEDDYAEKLIAQYTGGRRSEFIAELRQSLRQLKFFTNNDFAFKEVHNEELFYQNGKVVVEVVKLFQNYKIINSQDLQTLGDLFEQLLNKGFKQNEGQFFTPIPITRFIWDSLPLDDLIFVNGKVEPPKIIDYACGAGHFLTQGFAAVNDCFARNNFTPPEGWELDKLFGVEKDYRLARVSKISLFMNGVNKGKIKFGDGLENYPDEKIIAGTFDILTANPPYAVKNFKQFIRLKNEFATLKKISNEGSEIETLFVERISQLLKTDGIAAVILPSSILNKDGKSFIAARESLLQNFYIRAIAQFGSKTFSATGTNTIIVFLQRLSDSPRRFNLLKDSVNNILRGTIPEDWEDTIIFDEYIKKIKVDADTYKKFISRKIDYADWRSDFYFGAYVAAFEVKFALRDNYKFYDFALGIEFEKIHYFAMTYNQTTLVISAPADNSEQEKFLGYSWSNAKGDEGIKIKTPGGLLYDNENRVADNKLAAAVRAAFSGKKVEIPEAEKYYSYLKLSDMLDFGGVDFTKLIKLVDSSLEIINTAKFDAKYLKKLREVCKINIPKSEVADIADNTMISFVEMASVSNDGYIAEKVDKLIGEVRHKGYKYFAEGDIIIAKITPCMENGKCAIARGLTNSIGFGSTEFHTFRCDNEQILTEYLFVLLNQQFIREAAQKSMTGASGHRRVPESFYSEMIIPVPPIEIQRQIVSEFKAIDDEVLAQDAIIQKCNDDVKDKFVELFGNYRYGEKYSLEKLFKSIETGSRPQGGVSQYTEGVYSLGGEHISHSNGYLNLENIKFVPREFFNSANSGKIAKNDILLCKDGALTGKLAIVRDELNDVDALANEHIFVMKNDNVNLQWYLFYYLFFEDGQRQLKSNITGMAQGGINRKNLYKISIPIPPMNLQKEFAAFAQECDNVKEQARQHKSELQAQREQLVKKYFR